MTKEIRNSLLLVFTALIWGVAFVAQSKGGDLIGPYSFNCIRSLIGSAVLVPAIILFDRIGLSNKKPEDAKERKILIKGGILCGLALCLATNLQQLGLYMGSSSGKAGFLTACYILIVPILGLFFKKKCGWNIIVGVLLTALGLYFLCMKDGLKLQFSDSLVIMSALMFAIQIMLVDYFSPLCDGVRLSCIQFLVSGIIGLVPTFFVDMNHSIEGIKMWYPAFTDAGAWVTLLYAGVLSCGVAYTLQIIGQNGVNPTVASMLMSLESVFAVIAGAIILHERMSSRELIGCLLIFASIILAQIPVKKLKK